MNKKTEIAKLEKLPMEEKLKMLSDTDKAFIRGYIERAVIEQQRGKTPKRAKEGQGENSWNCS